MDNDNGSLFTQPNLISTTREDNRFYLNLVCHGIVVPAICLLGMLLNVITINVLMSKCLKESSYTYLTSLAVADFLSLLLFGINSIGRGHFPNVTPWTMFERFVYFPLALITTNASVYMIVSVTIERFVFLYKPIQAKSWCTQRKARQIISILWVLSMLTNIPRFFVFKVKEDGTLGYTAFGQSNVYGALSWIYFFVFALGCGLILIVFNILLIRGIHATNEKRRSLHGSNSNAQERHEEVRLTRTLISVIFLYLIGELPSSIFSRLVFSSILGEQNKHLMNELWYEICVCVATIFVVLQHSLNFVFYCVFNKRFYKIFKAKCGVCAQKSQIVKENGQSFTLEEIPLQDDPNTKILTC